MNQRRILPVVFGFLTLIGAVAPAVIGGDKSSLFELEFLVGHWVGKDASMEMEEYWIAPKGGIMLGLHRDVAQGKAAFFEFLRIEDRDDTLVYVASPRGGGTTEFTLVKIEEGAVVFENLEHDFPQRISYRRDGESLTARIEGEVGGEFKFTEWAWRLVE